ncbi:hypothetical protein I5E68_08740 [Novosphingobium sp. YJ-S2-02]|uniref:Uncharacterized protein n=1 Tax=Novosphingobium aureum TaxID=2792964 RepID=A0A931ML19_9SPHN|nr:hypothetical protein [Novosphingobium aureum]MBH0113034.1 hypothetical protein [Novosphingobium aureum]
MKSVRSGRTKSDGPSLKKMSVHFAVITLALTAVLAMFAQEHNPGSGHDEPVGEEQPVDEIAAAAQGQSSNQIAIASPRAVKGSFGPDRAISRGGGSIAAYDDGGYAQASSSATGGVPVPGAIGPLPEGMTLEEWLALHASPEQGMAQVGATQAQIDALIAQSQLRSGAASGIR